MIINVRQVITTRAQTLEEIAPVTNLNTCNPGMRFFFLYYILYFDRANTRQRCKKKGHGTRVKNFAEFIAGMKFFSQFAVNARDLSDLACNFLVIYQSL